MAPIAERPPAGEPGGTVLVVDDSEAMRYALVRVLQRAGFVVEEVATGAEALVAAAHCDLVVLDVHLPDMSGFDVCRRLRSGPATAGVAILQRSAIVIGDAATVQGLDSGADAYLGEPVDPAVLVATARALLRMRAAERRATAAGAALEAMMEATPTGHVLVDASLVIREINAAASGWSSARPGDPLGHVLPGKAGELLEQIAREALADGRTVSSKVAVHTATVSRDWSVHASPLVFADAAAPGLGITLDDVSDRERRTRAASERALHASVLADVMRELETVRGFAARAERLVELIVPELVDVATVEVAGAEGTPIVVAASSRERLEPEIVAEVLRSGEPHIVTPGAGSVSYVALPLEPHGAGAGAGAALSVAMLRGRVLRDDDVALLQTLAERVGLSLESARLYDRERHVAQTLQESLELPALPDTPGLDVAALFLPAGEGYGVSGDFYEMFPSEDGWFVVIGDVCGKGPSAAGLTALARHSIRAIALHDPSVLPSRIVSVLNEALMVQAGGMFATVQVARVTRRPSGEVFVQLCSAGHPPALHRRSGVVEPRSSLNSLVGVRRSLSYQDAEIELAPGDSLTFYTDGITESGRPAELFGQQRLIDAIAAAPPGAAAIVGAIEHAVRAYQVGELKDDVALLSIENVPG